MKMNNLELTLRYVSEEERAKIPAHLFAGPNHTFPINSQAHVIAASHLYGRAEDPESVKKKIISIAKAQGYALPPEWQEGAAEPKNADGTMIFAPGIPVTRVAGTENEIEGYGVLFTGTQDPDLYGTFFNAKTDYDLPETAVRTLYYQHGFDTDLGNTKIGEATLTKDEKGLHVRAVVKLMDADKWEAKQVAERQKYVEKILKMVDDGKLGFSSGAVAHLVKAEPVGDALWMTHWPLGEMSLTPNPAEPRTCAIPVRAFAAEVRLSEGMDSDGGWTLGHEASMGALDKMDNHLHYKTYGNMYDHADGRMTKDDLLQKHAANCDAYKSVSTRLLTAMLPDDMVGVKELRDLYALLCDTEDRTYSKELRLLATATETFLPRTSRLQAVRANSGRNLAKETIQFLDGIAARLSESVKQIEAIKAANAPAEPFAISQEQADEMTSLAMQAQAMLLMCA